jgi:alpha-1,2-mannosyltransferase
LSFSGPRGSRRIAWALAGGVLVLTVLLAAQLYVRTVRQERRGAGGDGGGINDLDRWLTLVPALVEGRAGYVDDAFATPPVSLLLVYPLTRLPAAWAQVAWLAVKPLLAAAVFALCLGLARRAGATLGGPTRALVLAAWAWPLVGEAQAGQLNLVMLLALVGGLRVAQAGTGCGDGLAGLLLALAMSIKVTPLAFLPYVLLKRRWRIAGFTVAGLGVWLLVVPALAFGWARNWRWLAQWSRVMLVPYVVHGQVAYGTGQSLAAVLTRLLRAEPAFVTWEGGAPIPHYLNILALPAPVVGAIVRVLVVLLAVIGAAWVRRPLATLACRRYLVEVGAVALFMLWASERTWVEHYVTVVLALVAVGTVADDAAEPDAVRRRARWALAAAAVSLAVTSDVAKVLGPSGGQYVRALGIPLLGSVLLGWALVGAVDGAAGRGATIRG